MRHFDIFLDKTYKCNKKRNIYYTSKSSFCKGKMPFTQKSFAKSIKIPIFAAEKTK